jgi:hypothetical protein
MSTTVMAACWPLQMPPTPKAVLVSLADNANDHGECWPSISKISERTCFSERAVQNAIQWLELHGALLADRSNGRHTRYAVVPDRFAPPQQMHPRTTCTPAADSKTPAADAPHPRSRCVAPPQEVPSNRKEPSLNRKSNRQETVLPEWLSAASWGDWCDHRKAIRSPMTPKAVDLAIRSLDELRRQGHDPTRVIENAIELGWRGLYAPPQKTSEGHDHAGTKRTSSRKLSAVEQVEHAIRERRDADPFDDQADALARIGYG